MNYYNEIKNKIIDNEVFGKVKDYSKERYKLKTYIEIGELLYNANSQYGDKIIKEYSQKLSTDLNKKYSVRYLFDIRKFDSIFTFKAHKKECTSVTFSKTLLLAKLGDAFISRSQHLKLVSIIISYDTVLYPLYSKKKVHCLTLNLRFDDNNQSTWVEAVCNAKHVWDENWFETGTSLKDFENLTYNCVKTLPNGYKVTKWLTWDSDNNKYVTFNWSTATITEDITLVASYGAE